MDAARSRMVRSLVILGALLGVFALHGLSLDRAEEMPAPVVQTMSTLQVDPHGVTERIEQLAMTAPFTLAVDTSDHHHLVMPCAAFLLLLLVWVGVVLPRRRFGDGPLLPRGGVRTRVSGLCVTAPDETLHPPDVRSAVVTAELKSLQHALMRARFRRNPSCGSQCAGSCPPRFSSLL